MLYGFIKLKKEKEQQESHNGPRVAHLSLLFREVKGAAVLTPGALCEQTW